MMPNRNYSAVSGYRYGFNGKENDNEVKGEGNQYDYGFRVYDSRVGRFLSTDPLEKSYSGLTPYQFASNNPIEGVDVDGREYVSSKEVRIKVEHGEVLLNIVNMNPVVGGPLKRYFEDPVNWPKGKIGADISIGKIDFGSLVPPSGQEMVNALDNTPGAPDPAFQAGRTQVENPVAKSTGLPDRRYKEREVSSASPGGSKGLAAVSVVINAIMIAGDWYAQRQLGEDRSLVESNVKSLQYAIADVNYALQKGDIPKEFQTGRYLSDIINVVLSGTSVDDNEAKVGDKIKAIGERIISDYSSKRKQFTGGYTTLYGPSGQVVARFPTPNPKYDPDYVKQNPGVINSSQTSSATPKKKG